MKNLKRILSLLLALNLTAFTAADAGAWYADAVQYAREHGLMTGTGNGRLRAHYPRGHGDRPVALYRKSCRERRGFCRRGADLRLRRTGSRLGSGQRNINGKPGNLFDPKGGTTRAELAAILQRFLTLEQGGP